MKDILILIIEKIDILKDYNLLIMKKLQKKKRGNWP